MCDRIVSKGYDVAIGIETGSRCYQMPTLQEVKTIIDDLKDAPVYLWYDIGHGIDEAGHHQHIYHSRLHTDFGAPVARYQQKDTSATLMTEVSSFLSLRHGDARLLAVQAASYFSPGFVPMQELTVHETGWTLLGQQVKGYYGPVAASDLPPISQEEISPWYLLPHHKRPTNP